MLKNQLTLKTISNDIRYTILVFGIYVVCFYIKLVNMSEEMLDFSVQLDQSFEISFNFLEGIVGQVIKLIGGNQ